MSVSTLVDGVLGSLDAAVRERCDAEGIIDALQSLGCAGSLADLRAMLFADPEEVKSSLREVAPAIFFAKLKIAAFVPAMCAAPTATTCA